MRASRPFKVRGPFVACALALFAGLPGCGSKSTSPSTWSYTVNFQSVAAAVSVDTLEVNVYDATLPDSSCAALVQKRRTKVELPKALVSVPTTPLCDLANGQGAVTVAYGIYSLLVVARHKGQDWLIGCNVQHVTRDEDPGTLQIDLTNFDESVLVPPTGCQTLSAHCGGGC